MSQGLTGFPFECPDVIQEFLAVEPGADWVVDVADSDRDPIASVIKFVLAMARYKQADFAIGNQGVSAEYNAVRFDNKVTWELRRDNERRMYDLFFSFAANVIFPWSAECRIFTRYPDGIDEDSVRIEQDLWTGRNTLRVGVYMIPYAPRGENVAVFYRRRPAFTIVAPPADGGQQITRQRKTALVASNSKTAAGAGAGASGIFSISSWWNGKNSNKNRVPAQKLKRKHKRRVVLVTPSVSEDEEGEDESDVMEDD
jgi:hypothetical protein